MKIKSVVVLLMSCKKTGGGNYVTAKWLTFTNFGGYSDLAVPVIFCVKVRSVDGVQGRENYKDFSLC